MNLVATGVFEVLSVRKSESGHTEAKGDKKAFDWTRNQLQLRSEDGNEYDWVTFFGAPPNTGDTVAGEITSDPSLDGKYQNYKLKKLDKAVASLMSTLKAPNIKLEVFKAIYPVWGNDENKVKEEVDRWTMWLS